MTVYHTAAKLSMSGGRHFSRISEAVESLTRRMAAYLTAGQVGDLVLTKTGIVRTNRDGFGDARRRKLKEMLLA
jgi:hypothetical protein